MVGRQRAFEGVSLATSDAFDASDTLDGMREIMGEAGDMALIDTREAVDRAERGRAVPPLDLTAETGIRDAET